MTATRDPDEAPGEGEAVAPRQLSSDGVVPDASPQDVHPQAPVSMAAENPEPGFEEADVPDEGAAPDEWDEEAPRPRRRGFIMRNPVMLVLVLAASIFLFIKYWPQVAYLIASQTPVQCGDISERPAIRYLSPEKLPPLDHDAFCELTGTVQNLLVLVTGEAKDNPNPRKRNEGRRYYVKLDGDRIFAVLAADREDVIEHRDRQGHLLGFQVHGTGRIIDPAVDATYGPTARTLRLKFGLPESEPIRIFDTTDSPARRWPAVLACVFLLLTATLAAFGLLRVVRATLARAR